MCANNAEKTGQIHALLAKELLHLFDRCTAKVNYTNIDHLACTEVKKANLVDCSLGDFVKRYGDTLDIPIADVNSDLSSCSNLKYYSNSQTTSTSSKCLQWAGAWELHRSRPLQYQSFMKRYLFN